MTRPIDVATSHTLDFVLDCLQSRQGHILEVGAGGGDLSTELEGRGLRVTAVESDERKAHKLRLRGVDVIHSPIEALHSIDISPLDAVIFGRSLHHVQNPVDALRVVSGLIRRDGLVIAEEFDPSAFDSRSLDWTSATVRESSELLDDDSCFTESSGNTIGMVHNSTEGIDTWNQIHQGIPSGKQLIKSFRQIFPNCELSHTAYLYRYFVDALPEGDASKKLAMAIFDTEIEAIKCNRLEAMGLRMCGKLSDT